MNSFLTQKIKFHYFFCMLLLLFLHNYNLNERILNHNSVLKEALTFTSFIEIFLSNSLFRFRLPLLMAISGYLFAYYNKLGYFDMLLKKARTLLLPTFLISIIGILITLGFEYATLGNHPENTTGLIGKSVLNFSAYDWYFFLIREPIPFQLWFLKTLFLLNAATPIINFVLRKFPTQTLLLLLVVYLSTHLLDTTSRDRAIMYYIFGVYVCMYGKNFEVPVKGIPVLPVGILFIAFCFARSFLAFYGKEEIGFVNVKWLLTFLFKLNEILGSYAVWFGLNGVVNYFIAKKWYQKIADSSFFIYAFHSPTMLFANTLILKEFAQIEHIQLYAYFSLPLVTFALLIGADILVKKVAPTTYGILTGGRGKPKKKVDKNTSSDTNFTTLNITNVRVIPS